ncbi:unnamed protein product [marine sediment metagenome]|uniref:Uncharacterized protein n=1 Tax=marine sediment metagenome TaxID=412755 RepID=X1LQJ4_9ZZZZ
MPRGQPDFGVYAVKETVSGLADLGELAARLGSIATFDRRGDVVWFDDFENDLSAWYELGVGTDHDAYMSAESARNGAFSCKLITGRTLGQGSKIIHISSGLVPSKIGIEVSFTTNANLDEFRVRLYLYDSVYYYTPEIRCYLSTRELKYIDAENDPIPFATNVFLSPHNQLYHTLKFVFDQPNQTYSRVILDNVPYDLSGIPVRKRESDLYPRYWIEIATRASADANVTSFVDDVIITQNEP